MENKTKTKIKQRNYVIKSWPNYEDQVMSCLSFSDWWYVTKQEPFDQEVVPGVS